MAHRAAEHSIHLAPRYRGGTIPETAHSGGVVERLMAPVLKTGRAQALVGSNPTPSANISDCPLSVNRGCNTRVRARRFERSSTGGARHAPGFQSRLRGITLQSQSAALDNPTPSALLLRIASRRIVAAIHRLFVRLWSAPIVNFDKPYTGAVVQSGKNRCVQTRRQARGYGGLLRIRRGQARRGDFGRLHGVVLPVVV